MFSINIKQTIINNIKINNFGQQMPDYHMGIEDKMVSFPFVVSLELYQTVHSLKLDRNVLDQ